MSTASIAFVFFDIGNTLGERTAGGHFDPYPSSPPLLQAVHAMGLGIGIITTLGSLSNAQGLALLEEAQLVSFLDPGGFVSEHDAGGKPKPAAEIYRLAAQRVGVPVHQCLFIGENLIEVIGAIAAGMQGLLKPSPPGRELPV